MDIIRNNLVYVHTYAHINTLYTYTVVVEMKYYLFLPGTMAVINAAKVLFTTIFIVN
jgi:hypothetical protein